jgi:hypothetical protein
VTPAAVTQIEVQAEAAQRGRRRRLLRGVLYYTGFALALVTSFLVAYCPTIVSPQVRLWVLCGAGGLMLAAFCMWTVDVAGFFRRWRRHSKGTCPHCNYNLRESRRRCPECGLDQGLVRAFGQYATRK